MTVPSRSHYVIPLKVAAGDRFQPTGFPDLGAALFSRPVGADGWQECLHVESPQSMANHLESATWDEPAQDQVAALGAVPFVRVVTPDGEFATCSRTEPHRLASAYIMDSIIEGTEQQKGSAWLPGKLGVEAEKPLDHRRLARAIYSLDPLSLIHGVFFAQNKSAGWSRQPKIARAVTAFIDASDVMPAVSGGVKTDYVSTEGGSADKGYGMVPHSRVEYTARDITAYVTVDHEQLRAYGLGDVETELLEAIIEFELASLFGQDSLRLRTACEFVVDESRQDEKDDQGRPKFVLPARDLEAATHRLSEAVRAAKGTLGAVTTGVWSGGKTARSKGRA